MKFNSIRFEISFIYTLILGAILTGFTFVLYFILSTTAYQEFDYNLNLKAQEISSSIRSYIEMQKGKPEALKSGAEAVITDETRYLKWWWVMGSGRRWVKQVNRINIEQAYINLADPQGRSIIKSENVSPELLTRLTAELKNFKSQTPVFRNMALQNLKIRFINYPFLIKNDGWYVVQVGIPFQPVIRLLQSWLYSLMLCIPIILVLSYFIGELLASRILKPVNRIITTSQKITSEDLGQRVKQEDYAVEMKSLVDTLNAMIGRLEGSFKHIEEFSSHVAHELKTPLTIIRGETELALMNRQTPEEYERALNTIGEETTRMLKTIDDLLYLAKLDYQPQVFKFETFDFSELFREICEQSKMLAMPKLLTIKSSCPTGSAMVSGDRLHLRRLFFNLIDNALKFTPPGGSITLSCEKQDGRIKITIEDTGRGISEQNLKKIFDKFFREDSRVYGNGLGLSIVQAILKTHHGEITVNSKLNEGTRFVIFLPLA